VSAVVVPILTSLNSKNTDQNVRTISNQPTISSTRTGTNNQAICFASLLLFLLKLLPFFCNVTT
jgi:hypothetical protein